MSSGVTMKRRRSTSKFSYSCTGAIVQAQDEAEKLRVRFQSVNELSGRGGCAAECLKPSLEMRKIYFLYLPLLISFHFCLPAS